MNYRFATEQDQATLEKLLYYAVSVPPGQTPPGPQVVRLPQLARYVRGWGTAAGDRGVVAEHEGAVVGGAWLRQWTAADHGYGYVREATPELSIAVVPEHRGKGIGSELLRRLLADAAKRFPAVSLSVAQYNRALSLYKRFGFKPVASGGDSITMLLRFE